MRDDLVARPPFGDPGTRSQHHPSRIGADDVIGQVMTLSEIADSAITREELEGRDWLEDRRPDGVVVDRACHDSNERLARPYRRQRHRIDVERLARVLVAAFQAV